MNITYKQIALRIEALGFPPYFLTEWKKIGIKTEKRVIAIQFHFPSIQKYIGLDFFSSVFASDGLNINYMNNEEVIRIEIPGAIEYVHASNYDNNLILN